MRIDMREKTCWLCRLIGHRCVTRRKYSVDGVAMSGMVAWGRCLRCWEPTPDEIKERQETTHERIYHFRRGH